MRTARARKQCSADKLAGEIRSSKHKPQVTTVDIIMIVSIIVSISIMMIILVIIVSILSSNYFVA